MLKIGKNDPLGVSVMKAIHSGDVDGLRRLLDDNPDLVTARIDGRTLLHVVADWPGHFPNGAAAVTALIAAGADPNASAKENSVDETPLHWAASSDDVAVLDALIDGGADIEAPGASIAGGPPLDDAVGYGQWRVARRLVERGAKIEKLWHAAALGIMSVVEQHFSRPVKPRLRPSMTPSGKPVTVASSRPRSICSPVALLNWVPDWTKETPTDIAESQNANDVVEWLRGQGARSAKELSCC